MKILVDADACPVAVKDILIKTSKRLDLQLIFVANQFMRLPKSDLIQCIVVPNEPDKADDHICDIMQADDLVISADIPLADRVIKKDGVVLDPRGSLLTKDNIGERLSMRNLMDELRSSGIETGGPRSYGKRERQDFVNQLDRFLTKVLKNR